MSETKIEFKCVHCGNYYDPNINIECPVCGKQQRLKNRHNSKHSINRS